MKEITVDIKPKRLAMPAPAKEAEADLPGGASLAKETVDLQLRWVRDRAKTNAGMLDGEMVKTLRDMVAVYETLAKVEREERKTGNLLERLAAMSDEQLDELERNLKK